MTGNKETATEQEDIEAMLAWYATGALGADETKLIEARLAKDPDFRRQLELVREEMDATISHNESLGKPAPGALNRLMDAIETEKRPLGLRSKSLLAQTISRIVDWFDGLSSPALAMSAVAAGLVICLQAALLTGIYLQDRPGGKTFEVASQHQAVKKDQGAFALIGFKQDATSKDIAGFLTLNRLSIVEGPLSGGLYRIRVAEKPMKEDALKQLIEKFRTQNQIISFIAPAN